MTTAAAPPQDGRLTFPRDFPKAPPGGIVLISFKDFKERGIAMQPDAKDDTVELDTLGIPTVQMKEHATDRCKTRTKRQKREKEERQKYLDNNQEVPWWLDWAENEGRRIAKPTNASESKFAKFLSAARDFKTSRRWPLPRNHQTDVSWLWTMLQVFLGIEVAVIKKDQPSRKKVFKAPLEDDEDESSDDDMDVDYDDDSDGEGIATDPKIKKARQFLADPERAIKIFLSSYIRSKGVIWSRINLEQAPRLCIFFLEFLLRSRTLPSLDPGIRSAVDIAKKALIELPLTGLISESAPDEFSKGCRECWGEKTRVFHQIEVDQDWLDKLNAANKADEEAEKEAEQEPTPELILPEPEQEGAASGWGATTGSGWGSSNGGGGWDAGGWGGDGDGANANEEVDNWALETEASKSSLTSLLGPTVLPLTHTTGVVEKSLRRITALIPVPTNALPKASVAKDAAYVTDAAGVESVLERTFPQVVLSPWLNWDGGEWPGYADPDILERSNGPVVQPPYSTKKEEESAPSPTPKPHDPGNDDITVLVQPEVFEKLVKGMSLAATWIQIVRLPVEAPAGPAPKKKGKKKAPANFWYLEELAGVFPSYWTTKAT